MPPVLNKVIRLDSLPLSKASFTPEGYLKDKPILTSVGIFEYINPDGSIRRELRLPEEVFAKDSLDSYKGRPIIVTHNAGLIDKDNVHENQIGTILSEGYKDGDDVRAEIIIHDTDEMKQSGYKELSLGYNLDLEEKSGVWNGEHYDAIQRNIRINHLALVREARAGEQARLNIDSRDSTTLIGGRVMRKTPAKAHRADGILSPEELAKAVEEYKASRQMADGNTDAEEAMVEPSEDAPVEEKVAFIKKQNAKDADEEVEEFEAVEEDAEDDEKEQMKDMLTRQDEDIQKLFDIIDTLLAEKAFDAAEENLPDEEVPVEIQKDEDKMIPDEEEQVLDAEDVEFLEEEEEQEDEDDIVIPDEEEQDSKEAGYDKFAKTHTYDCVKTDAEELIPEEDEEFVDDKKPVNMDSVDKIIRQRVKLGMLGKTLNLDGLENMSLKRAKKAVIKRVRPSVNLDGKSDAYINAMYDCAIADIKAKTTKNANYQKRQMFNKDSASVEKKSDSSMNARQRMIERHNNK